jgi:hypothetical protein
MQMRRLVENGDDAEGKTKGSTNVFSVDDQIVFWNFSRKQSMTINTMDSGWINNGENEVDRFGNEILTPKFNNSSFFRSQISLTEKTETASNDNINYNPPQADTDIDADNLVQTITKIAEQKIWELIDQPSKCIRDVYDDFDFQNLRSHDLSTLVPLGVDESSCLLVNSKETMLQCIREIEVSRLGIFTKWRILFLQY